jgi:hypothetical protein
VTWANEVVYIPREAGHPLRRAQPQPQVRALLALQGRRPRRTSPTFGCDLEQ